MQPGNQHDTSSGVADRSATADAAGAVADSMQKAPGSSAPLRLLLVDDTPANLKILARLLQKQGYETELAEDGRQAIDRFRSGEYDAILMDLQMPGVDGFAATIAIRAMTERRQVPIIALTAHVVEGTRERCLKVGMSDYLAKPIDMPLLISTIERHLKTAGSR